MYQYSINSDESQHEVYRIDVQNNRVYKISVQLNALKREKKSFKVLTQVAKNGTNVAVPRDFLEPNPEFTLFGLIFHIQCSTNSLIHMWFQVLHRGIKVILAVDDAGVVVQRYPIRDDISIGDESSDLAGQGNMSTLCGACCITEAVLGNFFHEGKCRKKPPPQPPEAQPIPTARTSTIDNMNNEDGESPNIENISADPVSLRSRPTSVQSQTLSIPLPSAPEDVEVVLQTETQQQTLLKCESPPPYCESADRNFQVDYGPPPTYEDAVRGTDINVQQLWQTVFIVDPAARENV
ncbi:UNVERIFIED_CONTAM: hypothetical protein NCL1_13004 [Trichonephila clavipes]